MGALDKKEVIRRIIAGESQSSLAREYGVKRQAVNGLWKRYQDRGEEVITGTRGRPKTRPVTSDEAKKLYKLVSENEPSAFEIKADRWTDKAVSRVAVKELKISISRTQTLLLMHNWRAVHGWGSDGSENSSSGSETAVDDEGDFHVPDLAEMQRINAETKMKMKPVAGVRRGKHGKGNRSVAKKRKKKNKKKR